MKISFQKAASQYLVLICGWTDGPLRLLQKYATLYPGFSVMTVATNWKDFFWVKAPLLSPDIHQALFEKKVIVHCLSNGGCLAYLTLRKSIGFHVDRMIIDSAPGNGKNASVGAIALTTWIKHDYLRWMAQHVLKMYFYVFGILKFLTGQPMDGLLEMRMGLMDHIPQLYLYSKADPLIDYRTVESHIQSVKKKGVFVLQHDFVDSDHVQHFRKYPVEYTRLIQNFYSKPCL